MTHEQFNKFQLELIDEVIRMKDTKGKEYANLESRFANFDRCAAKKGVSRLVVAGIYLDKHLDAIDSFIRTKKVMSEPIRGRIVDAITYLTLLAGMIEEENEVSKQNV